MATRGVAAMPPKPVVVGDRLFTNTSKRWISTANTREDMYLLRICRHIEDERRAACQENNYHQQVFKQHFDRVLDKNRLTKRPEAKKKIDNKREMAAYLRDVYSESSKGDWPEDLSDIDDIMEPLKKTKKTKKKDGKRKKAEVVRDGPAEQDDLSRASSRFSLASVATITRYLSETERDFLEEERFNSDLRKTKSQSTIQRNPPHVLQRGYSNSCVITGITDSTEIPRISTGKGTNLTEDKVEGGSKRREKIESARVAEKSLIPDKKNLTIDNPGLRVPSEITSVSPNPTEKIPLDKLSLHPKVLPPIYLTSKRRNIGHTVELPAHALLVEDKPRQTDVNLAQQLEDLRCCRYLRIPPSKTSQRRVETLRQARRKETVYVVVHRRSSEDLV